MDDYIDQILAEMPDLPLYDVVKPIMDEPIPETIKACLLQPLRLGINRPARPPWKKIGRKRKAIDEEFDPIPRQKALRSVKEYQKEILSLFADKK